MHRSDATTQPTKCAGQAHIEPPQRVSRSLNAPGRKCCANGVLDRGEQTRQSGGKKVRQKAECSMALRAIPSSDAQPLRIYARIAAVASKGAATRRMQRTRWQAGITPFLVGDVHLNARSRPQRNLQCRPLTRRRPPTREGLCGVDCFDVMCPRRRKSTIPQLLHIKSYSR